jgi:hypothetical protein
MAKQLINQLELIETLLNKSYKDDSKVLSEKEKLENGEKFEMNRNIVCHNIDFILYRLDPNKIKLFPYFNDVSGLKKICDYILFAQEGENLYIYLLIELKKGKESASKQLNAATAFSEYIIDAARRVGINITKNIKIIKIRISEERAKKRNQKTKSKKLSFDENGILNYDHPTAFRLREIFEVEFDYK